MKRPTTDHSSGFTLVELLVVIGMIAILAAILIPVIGKAQDESKRKADKAILEGLSSALGTYEMAYQVLPPSTLEDVGLKGANDINQGIEVVVATLASTSKGNAWYEFNDDRLCNTDGDQAKVPLKAITGGFASTELFEVMDHFGSPFVYIHHRNYSKPGSAARYRNDFGEDQTITPQKSEKTKEWQGAGTYQMWGFGPDGENNDGGGDDVVSW